MENTEILGDQLFVVQDVAGAAGEYEAGDGNEIAERWVGFCVEEQARRINCYRDYLDEEPGSQSGLPAGGASTTMFLVARAGVLGCGIDPQIVLDLIKQHWNPKCTDHEGRLYPWSDSDIRHKINDGAKSTHKEPDYLLPEHRYALLDAMIDDATLYTRQDMVDASWAAVQPILDHWKDRKFEFPNYASGTWGPKESDEMLARQGHVWRVP